MVQVLIGQYWAVGGFIFESLIVGRFVVLCWEICSFLLGDLYFILYICLGQFYCWEICSFLLVLLIVGIFVVLCWEI